MDAKLISWLRLIRSQNVGPIIFWELIHFYKSAEAVLTQLPLMTKRGRRSFQVYPEDQALTEIERCQRHGATLLPAYDPAFPALLKQLPDCPPVITVKGDKTLLSKPILGMVGARNASLNGCRLTERLARDLGRAGWVIASGLARGVDGAAHKGALTTGTIAVIAGGIDNIYPPEHAALYTQIAETGCLVTEMPFGMHPASLHFPRRNRIISGLSRGIIVTEAAIRSGSMITANFALEQNREVFAVPGSPADPRCSGSNALIKKGAVLVESAEDIARILTPEASHELAEDATTYASLGHLPEQWDDLEVPLMELLSYTPVSLDELIRTLQVSQSVLTLALIELELAGRIQRLPGNMVVRLDESLVA